MAKFRFDYLTGARALSDKGNFVSALHYLFLQRNKHEDARVDVEIGNTYAAMSIINEAVRFYLRALARDGNNNDALAGLAYTLKDIDDDASFYYLNLLLSLGDDIDIDYDDEEFFPLEVHDRRDKSEVMDMALELFENGNRDEAIETLKSIDKSAYQYCDAVLARASIEMDNNNARGALELANEALSVNPDHIGSHILKAMAFDALGSEDELSACLEELSELDVSEEEELSKAAVCLINYGKFEQAERFILKKLEASPYDRLMLLCLSSVYTAKGDRAAANATANRLCTIYPDDVEIKELSSLVFAGKVFRVPEEIFNLKKRMIKEIKDIFLTDSDVTSPDNHRRIKWLLQGENDLYLQSAVCAYVTCMPEYEALMNETLIDPFIPQIVKKQILLRKVCDEKTVRVKFVISDIFRSIKVKHPDVEENLKAAYYNVFIALAITELDFEKRLSAAFKKLSASFTRNGSKDLPVNGLAAILFCMATGEEPDRALEMFDCPRNAFDEVCLALNLRR